MRFVRFVVVLSLLAAVKMASAAPPATKSAPAAPTSSPSAITPPAPPARTPAAEARRKELEAAVPRVVEAAAKLIDAGKRREAATPLVTLRNALGEPRDVRVETLLAKIALAENRPDEAFKLVAPWANQRDKFNPDIADVYLVAGDAQLALGKNNVALVIFDWTASKAQGEPLVLAAEGCGKALMATKDFKRAAECFDFAVKAVKSIADAYGTYDKLTARLKEELAKARRLADVDLYGEDFVMYRDAETLRRIQKKYKEARQAYQAILKKFPDGPYADASTLYAAMCLIELDKPQEAGRELMALWHANRYGLYTGEAMLELGRIALEYDLQPKAAQGCFLFLDSWFQEFRNKPPLEIEKRAAVPEAAKKVTKPPAKEKYVDFWGNVKKSEIKPGMLVNPDTCPWYLDDLKEQCAMYMGFLYFAEGDKENALAWYKKILECDPATRNMEVGGVPNDYSRLKFGADHGFLVAMPEELALYNERQKLAILIGDFFYVTQQFELAKAMFRDLLAGRFGALRQDQTAYPHYAIGLALFRESDNPQGDYRRLALAEMEKVLALPQDVFTKYAAAGTFVDFADTRDDPKIRERSKHLLAFLALSKADNHYTYKARILYSRELIHAGRREEGLNMLRNFPASAPGYRAVALDILKDYEKSESSDIGPNKASGTGR